MSKDYMTPEEIKAVRKALGDSQEQFANRLGASPFSVCNWERGKFRPHQNWVEKIEELKEEI